jgi:hypothetical protein
VEIVRPEIQDVLDFWEDYKLFGDPMEFYDYHEQRGWLIPIRKGSKTMVPIKSWKGAARTWSRNQKAWHPPLGDSRPREAVKYDRGEVPEWMRAILRLVGVNKVNRDNAPITMGWVDKYLAGIPLPNEKPEGLDA